MEPQAPQQPSMAPQPTPMSPEEPQMQEQPAMQPAQPAMSAPQPAMAQVDPGHSLGLASLILSLLGFTLISLILGIMGMKKSKEAGMSNGLAKAGVIISVVSIILGVIAFAFIVIAGVMADSTASMS